MDHHLWLFLSEPRATLLRATTFERSGARSDRVQCCGALPPIARLKQADVIRMLMNMGRNPKENETLHFVRFAGQCEVV
jgi:hypothetical protein